MRHRSGVLIPGDIDPRKLLLRGDAGEREDGMNFTEIRFDRQNRTAIITIDRPAVRNCIEPITHAGAARSKRKEHPDQAVREGYRTRGLVPHLDKNNC
jgi:hypothetical protein